MISLRGGQCPYHLWEEYKSKNDGLVKNELHLLNGSNSASLKLGQVIGLEHFQIS